jgi:hypothetical protein
MLVIDANVARAACGGEGDGFAVLGDELVSIPLMWSEARAGLHLALWKGQIGREDSEIIHDRPYDAEYVALAKLLGCRLVTLDARLRRGTERLGFVVTPAEL